MTQPANTTTPAPEKKTQEPAAPRTPVSRVPWWASHTPTIAVAGLIIVVVELASFRLVPPLWWAIGNAVVVLLLILGVGLRKRAGRSSGGLLGRLASGRGRTGGAPGRGGLLGRGSGAGPGLGLGGKSGPGRLSRLLGGRSGSSGSSAGHRSGSAPGSSRGGLLGRLTGGKGRTAAAGKSAGPSGGAGSKPAGGRLSRLLGGGRGSGSSGSATRGGASGSTGSSSGRRSILPFGKGRSSAGRAAGSSGGTTGNGRPPTGPRSRAALLRRGKAIAAASKKATATKPGDATTPTATRGRWNPLRRRTATANETTTPVDDIKPEPVATETAEPATTEEPARPPGAHRRAQPVPQPRTGRHHHPEGVRTMTLAHTDDSSLQRWGRNLNTFAPALDELTKKHTAIAEEDKVAAAALTKLASQSENDLPVSPRLQAEVDAIAAEMRQIADAQEALVARRRALTGRADALPASYRREHETDEDRLNSPRKSRHAEKRADVGHAEQDV